MEILKMILIKQQEKHEKMIMGKDFSQCPYIVNAENFYKTFNNFFLYR